MSNVDLPIKNLDPTSKFILKAIDGLGPPDINVALQDSPYSNGIYQGSHPILREIVARIKLNPDYATGETVESLRTTLYTVLTVANVSVPSWKLSESRGVTISLMLNGTAVATVNGFPKKFEIVPFAKEPEVQITFACKAPYLESALIAENVASLSLSNPIINYDGTAPGGFHFELDFTAGRSDFRLQSAAPLDTDAYMYFTYAFLTGDRLIVNTMNGERKISRVRSGVEIPIPGALSSDSTWLKLQPGANPFTTNTSNFTWYLFEHRQLYWGV
jgi:hypothetical protein